MFTIHPPKYRKNNAYILLFPTTQYAKEPLMKTATRIDMMLETVRFFDRELKRDPYIWNVGSGWETAPELFVSLSF